MRSFLLALTAATALATAAQSATVYPLDRATILVGSPFDFKVEFNAKLKPEDVRISVNGADYKTAFGTDAGFIEMEKGKDDKELGSAVLLRGVKITKAGAYKIEVAAGAETKTVTWMSTPRRRCPRPRTSSSCSVTACRSPTARPPA